MGTTGREFPGDDELRYADVIRRPAARCGRHGFQVTPSSINRMYSASLEDLI